MTYKKVEVNLRENWETKLQSSAVSPIYEVLRLLVKKMESELNNVDSSASGFSILVKTSNVEQITSIIHDYFVRLINSTEIEVNEIINVNIIDIDEETAKKLISENKTAAEPAASKGSSPDFSQMINDFRTRRNSVSELSEESKPLDDDEVNAWIGALEFKKLIAECRKIAPLLTESKTEDVFIARQYLFSINDGYGLSTYLKTFANTLSKLNLYPCEGDKTFEIKLRMPEGVKDASNEFSRVLEEIEQACYSRIICGIDISEWLPKLNEIAFNTFLRDLNKYTGRVIFVFRVPFLEKDALDNVKQILADIFTIHSVPFVPFSTEELLKSAEDALKAKSFTLSEDAIPLVSARISEEKRDGRFYGIHTMKKIAREMIYLKQLANIDAQCLNTEICRENILNLVEGYDSFSVSGEQLLGEMIGLTPLKQRIHEIIKQIETTRIKQALNPPCIHMRFSGNPGTGKTTVARIIGKILQEKGVLRNGNFFEYNGRDFCGRYVGETAPKTAAICRDAYGSVLFIDEAYSLFNGVEYSSDYGREALSTLISEMENHRNDLLVIMAGYTDEMNILMKGNAGLASRMPYLIEFPNYSRTELNEIFLAMAGRDFSFNDEFKAVVKEFFDSLSDELLNSKDFSNARYVRNLYERTWGKAVLREQLNNDSNIILIAEDFLQASSEGEFRRMLEKKTKKIGFTLS